MHRYPLVKLNLPKTIVGKPLLAKVAYFSSRGPNSVAPAILKVSILFEYSSQEKCWPLLILHFLCAQPDIAAPGVNILASTSPLDLFADGRYVMHSGTSMSTPHVSGIVALLKVLHPNWSPAAIRSALVTTGRYMHFHNS